MLALDIICDAVDRYKALCEGNYNGELPLHCKMLVSAMPLTPSMLPLQNISPCQLLLLLCTVVVPDN